MVRSGLSCWLSGKESACSARDLVSIPGISLRERNDNPLLYSCLENPMDRRASRATVHAVAKNQTQLSVNTHFFKVSPVADTLPASPDVRSVCF